MCTCRADRDNGGGFVAGFVVGGAIFGALGFIFAPQISAALLNDEQRLRLPKFLDEEEKSPEATKQVRRTNHAPTIPMHLKAGLCWLCVLLSSQTVHFWPTGHGAGVQPRLCRDRPFVWRAMRAVLKAKIWAMHRVRCLA